jgi:dienelactone hydrolase
LKGESDGKAVTISGDLRLANRDGRMPVVVFVAGSGGFEPNLEVWRRLFHSMGVSSFALDGFGTRGVAGLVSDQSQFGFLNMILDLYQALPVLAAHPKVDKDRIIVFGWSRGAKIALHSSLKRFNRLWNKSGIELAAHIALYTPCNRSYIDDLDVTGRPVRLFHGVSDDWTAIGPCRDYAERLRRSGKDVAFTEFSDTHHAFDLEKAGSTPWSFRAQTQVKCRISEQSAGVLINVDTGQPFRFDDSCVGYRVSVAYSESATRATQESVRDLITKTLKWQ